MNDLHRLRPCATCDTRMAVPGFTTCTRCVDLLAALDAELAEESA